MTIPDALQLTVMKIIGMILGMGGAILCVTTQKSGALASNALLGNVLCALCALFFGINLYIEKYFIKQQLNNVTILKYLFLGATVSAFCVNGIIGFHAPLITDALKGEWHLMPWIVLLFILVGPTFLNYFLSIFGLRYLKTTVASLYGYLSLIVASVVSYLLKQDKFSWFQILAMIMICLSIYFVEIADKKDKTQSK